MNLFTCGGCGRQLADIRVLPVYCSCGNINRDATCLVDVAELPPETLRPVPKDKVLQVPDQDPHRKRVAECLHRGAEIRREVCETCKGKVQVKVFACDRHGECTISKEIQGVYVCDGGGI